MRPGAVVYEIRDTAGKVHGYLMVPSRLACGCGSRPGREALVVTVSDVENMPEMGGGGAGGGGGM
jgi:hypothetical protein